MFQHRKYRNSNIVTSNIYMKCSGMDGRDKS